MLPQIGIRLRLYDGIIPLANLTGIQALWWDAATVMDTDLAVGRSDSLSTDADGWITLNITHCSLLNAGDSGALLLFRPNAIDTRDSELFAGVLTVESLGPGRDAANHIPYAMRLDLGYWNKTGIGSVQTGLPAPDGTLTACRLVEDATSGNHFAESQLHTIAPGTAVVGAVSIKPAGRTRAVFRVEYDASNYLQADIDLAAASIVATSSLGGTLTGATATLASDGSVRVEILGSLTTAGRIHLPVYLADTTGSISYQGDGISGIDVWGAKLEVAAAATPFVNDSFIGVDMWYHPYDPTDHGWVRPADWLALPAVAEGEQKFIGLHAVFEGAGNFATVKCVGAYVVDWGDGTVESIASNVQANHKYDYATYDPTNATLCSRGYKQAVVTVTPQAGQTLTQFYLNGKYTQAGLYNNYTTGWLDIEMAMPGLTVLAVRSNAVMFPVPRMLERFSYIGTNKVASWDYCFYGCIKLKYIPQLYTAYATTAVSLYQACSDLRAAPPMDLSRCADISGLYQNDTALVHAPPLDTAYAATASGMYNTARSLRYAPPLDLRRAATLQNFYLSVSAATLFPNMDTPVCLSFVSTFSGATNMRRSPKVYTGVATTLQSMYQACSLMAEAPWLDTGACSIFTSMLNGCILIEIIPLYNTSNGTVFTSFAQGCYRLRVFPAIDTSKGTLFNGLVRDCVVLEDMPLLDTALGTNFNYMLSGTCMTTIPPFNFSSAVNCSYVLLNVYEVVSVSISAPLATEMIQLANGGYSLRELTVDASGVTSAANMAYLVMNCPSLKKLIATGARYAFSAANCQLDAAALNVLFTSLGTAAGAQTITVTGNFGVLEAGYDPSIATAKGWTVVA